jgi:acyl-CoA thioester hydrolase
MAAGKFGFVKTVRHLILAFVTAAMLRTVASIKTVEWFASSHNPSIDSQLSFIDSTVSKMNITAPHVHPIGIFPADIDFMGHVNNARYLTWVQDAVLGHWNSIAPPEAITKYLWVALKHEITYRRPAFLNDDVSASVVLEKVHGARSFYQTFIKRGEEVLAEVRSSWCCIDAETLRPARIAADIAARFGLTV